MHLEPQFIGLCAKSHTKTNIYNTLPVFDVAHEGE